MRVEACTPQGNRIKLVWHCEEARKLLNVEWVDDETCEYAELNISGRRDDRRIDRIVRKAKKIVIQETVIYINPLPDDESDNGEKEPIEHGKFIFA